MRIPVVVRGELDLFKCSLVCPGAHLYLVFCDEGMFLSQPFSGVAQGRVLVSCVSPGAHLHPFFCEGAMAFVKMLSVGEDVFVKVFVCVGKRPCLNFSTFVYFQIIFGRGILLDCVSGKPFEMAGNQDFVEPDLSILPTLLDLPTFLMCLILSKFT